MTPCQPRPSRSGWKSCQYSATSSAVADLGPGPAGDLRVQVEVAVAAGERGRADPPAVEPARRASRAAISPMPLAQLLRAPVEAREGQCAEPGRVAVGLRAVEQEERRARATPGRPGRAMNHSCSIAAVVEREVADELHPASVGRAGQRLERCRRRRAAARPRRTRSGRSGGCSRPGRTASGRSTFAPSASTWSSRCLDPGQVAAEELAVRVARLRGSGRRCQSRRQRPGRRRRPRRAARREAVDEDLVDHRGEVPVGPAGLGGERKSSAGGTSWACSAGAVEPAVAEPAAGQQPAVGDDRVAQRQLGAPPRLAARARSRPTPRRCAPRRRAGSAGRPSRRPPSGTRTRSSAASPRRSTYSSEPSWCGCSNPLTACAR